MSERVALLRGRHLNSSEMQNYERLHTTTSYECVGIGADYGTPPDLEFPVRTPRSVEGIAAGVHRKAGTATHLALSKFGANNYLIGVDERLGDAGIVHTVETYWPFSAQAARHCKRNGTPLVVTQWENIPHNFEDSRIRRHCKEYVHRHADAFVAVTERAAFALRTEGVNADRINVIPPGVDTERFRPSPSSNQDNCPVELLYVGRLNRTKGICFLLEAIRQLKTLDLPAFHLNLIGGGPDDGELQSYARKLNVTSHVTFEGYLPYDEIPGRYRNADIFVLPSIPVERWQEQFGMVLVEAMASGLPVVTTRSGSIPEVVGDAAELVQPADGVALAAALEDLIRSPERRARLGKRSRERAESAYTLDQFAERTAQLYDSL